MRVLGVLGILIGYALCQSTADDIAAIRAMLENALPRVLDGSGTTNPQEFFARLISDLENQSRLPFHITYRGIGSGAGQTEFINQAGGYAPLNNFGCGDVPLSSDAYTSITTLGGQSVTQIPILVGGVAFFHNLPFIDATTGPLNMSGCALVRVFSGIITQWDDDAILSVNPLLKPKLVKASPDQKAITVFHRVLGSSSTYAMSNYLANVAQKYNCTADYLLGDPGTSVVWPNKPNFFPADGSGLMVEALEGKNGSIGYVELGFGKNEGLREVQLQKIGDPTSFRNSDSANLLEPFSGPFPFPPLATDDFGALGPRFINVQSNAAWPMTLVTYLWARTNMTQFGSSGALFKAFAEYALSDKGQALLPTFFFDPLPPAVLNYSRAALQNITLDPTVPTYTFEQFETTLVGTGAGPYVISGKRQQFASTKLDILDTLSTAALESIGQTNAQVVVTQNTLTTVKTITRISTGTAAAALFFALLAFCLAVIALAWLASTVRTLKRELAAAKAVGILSPLDSAGSNGYGYGQNAYHNPAFRA